MYKFALLGTSIFLPISGPALPSCNGFAFGIAGCLLVGSFNDIDMPHKARHSIIANGGRRERPVGFADGWECTIA